MGTYKFEVTWATFVLLPQYISLVLLKLGPLDEDTRKGIVDVLPKFFVFGLTAHVLAMQALVEEGLIHHVPQFDRGCHPNHRTQFLAPLPCQGDHSE